MVKGLLGPYRSAFVALFVSLGVTSRQASASDATLGLSFTIASEAGSDRHVVDDRWVNAQIAEANRLFLPTGTSFRWVYEKPLPDAHASMRSRADRDALTSLTEHDGVVDVFLVRELEDVDEPGRFRRGVCWTGKGGKRFVILSRIAEASVLAHELGHFFGNAHVAVTDNVMSYSRTKGTLPFFDEHQEARIRSSSARLLATGRLVDVGPPLRFF